MLALWPETDLALTLFVSISTQWRVGPGGPIGLDYNVAFSRMARMGLDDDAHENLFQDLRAIEREALTLMHKT